MDHPKCKICGDRHRLGPCAQSLKKVSPKAANEMVGGLPVTAAPYLADGTGRRASTSAAKLKADLETGLTAGETATPRKRAPRGTFDRKAYQRELMRKRRAAAREKSATQPMKDKSDAKQGNGAKAPK